MEINNKQPKVIFVDAVGTLFGVKGSVGEVYASMAQRFGVKVSAQDVNTAFYQSFKAAPAPIFPHVEPDEIPQAEFEWWRLITLQTFEKVGAQRKFPDFSAFFTELYLHFATAEPWFVYSDVLPALQRWWDMGIQLGVLSNFDSRLYPVLQALGLAEYFTSVTISTQVGAAKPEGKIFAIGLHKHDCPPAAAWHIGDSLTEDYHGAKAAGIRGIWLKRWE